MSTDGMAWHFQEHWETHEAFCQLELHRREENAGGIRDGRLFVSHSWRLSDNQLRKRRMIAEFSLPAKVISLCPAVPAQPKQRNNKAIAEEKYLRVINNSFHRI